MFTHIHTYTHTHIHSYTHTLIHTYTHTHIHSYTHTLIHSYTHTHIHSYTHTLIHSYTHTLIHSYTHTHNHHTHTHTCSAVPSVLEFSSYCINFHSFLAGPPTSLQDYRDFIDGSNMTTGTTHSSSAAVSLTPTTHGRSKWSGRSSFGRTSFHVRFQDCACADDQILAPAITNYS